MTLVDRIRALENSIRLTEFGVSSLCKDIYYLNGMSSPKTRRLINNLASYHKKYCEIGSWRGSTIVSAAYGNDNLELAVAIDNFSQFQKREIFNVNPLLMLCEHDQLHKFLYESTPKEELLEKIAWLAPKVQFIEGDFNSDIVQNQLKELPKFDLYLFDGEHSYQSQYDGIAKMFQFMEDQFTLCVDDWTSDKDSEVRRGTYDALKDLGAKLCAEWAGHSDYNGDIVNYWNGMFCGVIQK